MNRQANLIFPSHGGGVMFYWPYPTAARPPTSAQPKHLASTLAVSRKGWQMLPCKCVLFSIPTNHVEHTFRSVYGASLTRPARREGPLCPAHGPPDLGQCRMRESARASMCLTVSGEAEALGGTLSQRVDLINRPKRGFLFGPVFES